MRQVIPFSKDIEFKTKIDSITSISLEHTLKLDNDNTLCGTFNINGDYKVTENSRNKELFSYDIPFDIVLDNSYIIEESTVDIDDFYYEIVDDKILRVNIVIAIDGEIKEVEELSIEDEILNTVDKKIDPINEDDNTFVFESTNDDRNNIKEEDNMIDEIIDVDDGNDVDQDNYDVKVKDMFSAISNEDEETFTTYNVHIVKESETLDMILKKYNITKDMFLEYNQEDEVVVGNKLLIPANNE